MRATIRRLPTCYGFPPDKKTAAIKLVMDQAELLARAAQEEVSCQVDIRLRSLGVDGLLDFLRLRHLLRGVANEQRQSTDQDGHPGQPQHAVGITVVQRLQLGGVHGLHRAFSAA